MTLVATVVADPHNPAIDGALSNRISETLAAEASSWLEEGVACDFTLREGMQPQTAYAALSQVLAGIPVDFAIQNADQRRKKGFIADMDSTMIMQECIDELAEVAGCGEQVAEITRRAMNGEFEFETALRQRVALLKGLPESVISRVLEERISPTPGAKTLVATIRGNGGHTLLVSGGFAQFTVPVAAMLGFEEQQANRLGISAGKLTGTVEEPILGREAKKEALMRVCAQNDLAPADFMAVGDGANDLAMLELAGAGVAFHAKPVVAEKAQIRIDHGDLTALLYLQGYRRSEFFE
jgi:phosphoserine phosphatase